MTTLTGKKVIASLLIGSIFAVAQAKAASVLVDGIKDSNDTYTDSFVTNWTNGHKTEDSIYADGTDKTTVYYAEENNSLFVYMDVPLYAKNMIWGSAVSAQDILDYQGQWLTHHNGTLNLDYKTATGSEKSIFSANFGDYEIGLQGNINNGSGGKDKKGGQNNQGSGSQNNQGSGILNLKTSLEYLLDNGCDTTDCAASDVKMSFEIEFDLTQIDGKDLLNGIQTNGIEYHLSPERRVAPIPIPAAVWLFASALGALGWLSRRRKVNATA
jgi:hypothetical protein